MSCGIDTKEPTKGAMVDEVRVSSLNHTRVCIYSNAVCTCPHEVWSKDDGLFVNVEFIKHLPHFFMSKRYGSGWVM